MKIIICTRDLEYGIGTYLFNILPLYENDPEIDKIAIIGPETKDSLNKFRKFKKVLFINVKLRGKFFITKQPFFAYEARKRVVNLLKTEKYDLLHTHCPIILKGINIPVIWTAHGLRKEMLEHKEILKNSKNRIMFHIVRILQRIYTIYDNETVKYSKKIITVSNYVKERAQELYSNQKDKFIFIESPINTINFKKGNKNILRKKWGLKREDRVVLYVGRFDPLKGLDILIKAISYFKESDIKLLIVGSGPLEKEKERHKFIISLGRIAYEEMPEIYSLADVFVLPSLYENTPMSVLEAIACETPVVANNVGDVERMIYDKSFLINKVTSFKIFERLELLFSLKKNKVIEITQKNRSYLLENYTLMGHYNKIKRVYNEVLH
jgi:glycosyltransferase involved in cell wall biosynthesis